jgi:copper chaperone CopZ
VSTGTALPAQQSAGPADGTAGSTHIEGDLASEPGIEQVAVDTGTRRVRITYDQEQTSPAQLHAKLSEIGYPAAP